jgi:hypothetical protein
MNKVPQSIDGVSVMLEGGLGKDRSIFSFQAKKQFGGQGKGWGGSDRHSSKSSDLPTPESDNDDHLYTLPSSPPPQKSA